MKRYIIFLATILFVLPLSLVSCSDDDNDTTASDGAPQVAAAGVYSGTFTRVKQGETEGSEAEGTVTIGANQAYIADFSLVCTTFEVNHNVTANIAYSNDGFAFNNNEPANTLGSKFVGRIDGNKEIIAKFTLRQRSGRVTNIYNYTFTGRKVNGE